MFQKVSRLSLEALDGSFNVRGASDVGIYEDSQAFNALEKRELKAERSKNAQGVGAVGFSRSVDGGVQ